MSRNPQEEHPGLRIVLPLALAVLATLGARQAAAKLETWRQETSSAFTKGHRDRLVVAENSRVRLGQSLGPLGTIDAARVWDLVRTTDGTVYAATGDSGKVFRRASKDDAPWAVAFDASDSQVLALAVRGDGRVFAGTGPGGRIFEVSDPGHPLPPIQLVPDVKYIWDLAFDAKGNLYAATGPTGQLWKIAPDGSKTLVLDSKHAHLLCVAIGKEGEIYAGSDGEGLIYRLPPEGKGNASVVYDAPQSEVRSLLVTPDGTLYAGTAAESGGGGGSGRGSSIFSGTTLSENPGTRGATAAAAPEPPRPPTPALPKGASTPSSSVGGSATPRAPSPGDNAVYRIGPDGVPREVFRAKVLIYALAWQEGRLYLGTGPEGQLYEIAEEGHVSSPIARLDHGQVLALLSDPKGGLLIGAGDPGAVLRLNPGHVASGTLLSDVLDTKLIARFGALSWRAETPAGTAVTFQVRTGNVAEPDPTWSNWGPEQTNPEASRAEAPPGRFAQYRATLSTSNPAVTPELRSVALRYQTANLPPEITKLEVPDVSLADGTSKQNRLTLRWDVTDPNGDDLSYTLHIRKDGWPDWVRLGEENLTSSSYDWDTSAVPAGTYRARITATDRLSNSPEDTLKRERTSEPFLVDHDPPTVSIAPKPLGAVITLRDNLTRLVKAAYALDGGEWTPLFPDDGLFDSAREVVTLSLPDLKKGTHIVVVRTTDAAGNVATGDALVVVK